MSEFMIMWLALGAASVALTIGSAIGVSLLSIAQAITIHSGRNVGKAFIGFSMRIVQYISFVWICITIGFVIILAVKS